MGGVAGHLNHLHEELDFTFGEIKSVLSDVASANIDVFEKVDGQNVFFTWNDEIGQIRTARNDGDIKRGGMTPDEYASKWAAHPNPNVAKAFMNGFHAIQRAMSTMDSAQLQAIFGDHGQNYINAEIMYTKNPNIITYSADWIVLHNMHKFDDEGKKSIETAGEFSALVSAVETAENELDAEGWQISGPKLVELNDISDGSAYNDFVSALDAVTGMSDDATIGDYVAEKLRAGPVGSLPIPVNQQEEIIKTILSAEGAKKVNDLKKMVPKDLRKSISALATTTNRYKTISRIVGPIEKAISDFAIEVLRGLESFFVDEHDAEISRMRGELEAAIAALQNAPSDNAEAAAALLDKQLGKLGPHENLASTMEGIVFEHPPGSKVLYKLTGSFAMVNQIIGRASRLPKPESQNEMLLRSYIRSAIMVG
tara:strand:+ start:2540 stop:3814 length:1275 start_codon:yes stop_codon:yes gene_type:complete